MIIRDYKIPSSTYIDNSQLVLPLDGTLAIYEGIKVTEMKGKRGHVWLNENCDKLFYVDANEMLRQLPVLMIHTPVPASTKPRKKAQQDKAPLH